MGSVCVHASVGTRVRVCLCARVCVSVCLCAGLLPEACLHACRYARAPRLGADRHSLQVCSFPRAALEAWILFRHKHPKRAYHYFKVLQRLVEVGGADSTDWRLMRGHRIPRLSGTWAHTVMVSPVRLVGARAASMLRVALSAIGSAPPSQPHHRAWGRRPQTRPRRSGCARAKAERVARKSGG